MALTIPVNVSDTISLEEFLDYANNNVDVDCEESVLEMSPMLKMLSNNGRFLCDFILKFIETGKYDVMSNYYSLQVIMLAYGKKVLFESKYMDAYR